MKSTLALLSLISVLFQALNLSAAEIINIIPSKSDHHVVVEYDLMSDTPIMVNVTVTVEGVDYPQEQLSLEGDIGRHVKPGKLKKFVWNVKKDFPAWPDIEVSVRCKE